MEAALPAPIIIILPSSSDGAAFSPLSQAARRTVYFISKRSMTARKKVNEKASSITGREYALPKTAIWQINKPPKATVTPAKTRSRSGILEKRH